MSEMKNESQEVEDNISDDDDEPQEVINVFDRLCAAAESDDVDSLPPHKCCGNHTLNLVPSLTASMPGRTSHTRECTIGPWVKYNHCQMQSTGVPK